MISTKQESSLLKIADLNDGWGIDGAGKRFKPIIIRNTRFLLTVFKDPTIDIVPIPDGKSIVLVIHKPIDSLMFNFPEEAKAIVVNVYSTKFTIDVLDGNCNVVYQEDYNMKQFVNTYILS